MPLPALSRLAQRGILALLSAILALAVGEVGLRVVSRNVFYVWPPHLRQEFHPSPGIMPGVSGNSRFEINSLGLRGDEHAEAHQVRILALGGSTTECLYLDQSEAWPHLLQESLGPGVWIGNAGRSGQHTRHHRLQAEKLLEQLPRINTVIVLAGVNDLSIRLSQDDTWAPVDFTSETAQAELMQEAFEVRPPRFATGSLFERTALGQALKKLGRSLRDEGTTQDRAGRVYEVWRRRRQEAPVLRRRLPDLAPALAEYAENLRAIAALAARRRARVVFVTQPALWRNNLPQDLEQLLWMGGVGRFQQEAGHEYYSATALAAGMEAYNRALLAVCRETSGAVCVDLAEVLPRDTTAFYDDVHFNEAGSRTVARTLAEGIRKGRVVPRADGAGLIGDDDRAKHEGNWAAGARQD